MFVALKEMGEVFSSGHFLHWFLRIRVCLIVEFLWFLVSCWWFFDRERERRTDNPCPVSKSGIINPYSRHNTTQLGESTVKWVPVRNPYKKTILGDKGTFLHFATGMNEADVSVLFDIQFTLKHDDAVFFTVMFILFSFHDSLVGGSPVRYEWDYFLRIVGWFCIMKYNLMGVMSILFYCFALGYDVWVWPAWKQYIGSCEKHGELLCFMIVI